MADQSHRTLAGIISENLLIEQQVVEKVIYLLDQDNTVPFIARYRKEETKGLDSTRLRSIESLLHQLRYDAYSGNNAPGEGGGGATHGSLTS